MGGIPQPNPKKSKNRIEYGNKNNDEKHKQTEILDYKNPLNDNNNNGEVFMYFN